MLMERLKLITRELNKLFETDHNPASFTALQDHQLLQILTDLLHNMGLLAKLNVNQDRDGAILQVLNVLEAIRYSPEGHVEPSEFRNGLSRGSPSVLHPLLEFLLRDRKEVTTRHYLAKYVTPIEVPKEFLEDTKTFVIYSQHRRLIDEFWQSYGENRRSDQIARETQELENDIWQMKMDLTSLSNRLRLQQGKLGKQSEDSLKFVRDYCTEVKKRDRLVKQVADEKSKLEELKSEVHALEGRGKIGSLRELIERADFNREALEGWKGVLGDVDGEVEIVRGVAEACEPTRLELEDVQANILEAQNHSGQFEVVNRDLLDQTRVLAKKKSWLSKQILCLRLKNDEALAKIDQLTSLLDGDVLRGKELKDYVANLRKLSDVYKKNKQTLNSLQVELGILQRTLEVLTIQEPDLQAHMQSRKVLLGSFKDSQSHRDILRQVYRDHEKNRGDFVAQNIKYLKVKDSYEYSFREHAKLKEHFEVYSGGLTEEVEGLEMKCKELQDVIELKMEELRRFVEEGERYQDMMMRYSQCIIENTEDRPYVEVLEDQLGVLLARRSELEDELVKKQEMENAAKKEVEAFKAIQSMVALKLSSV